MSYEWKVFEILILREHLDPIESRNKTINGKDLLDRRTVIYILKIYF